MINKIGNGDMRTNRQKQIAANDDAYDNYLESYISKDSGSNVIPPENINYIRIGHRLSIVDKRSQAEIEDDSNKNADLNYKRGFNS